MVDKVRDKGSKSPVITAVLLGGHNTHTGILPLANLEQVTDGHGSMGKAMNKECFQESLDIVQSPAGHGNAW